MNRGTLWLNDWAGEDYKSARLKLNLTQQDVADLARTTKATISNIERDTGSGFLKAEDYQMVLERYYAYTNFLTPVYIPNMMLREMRLNGENRIITPEDIYRKLTT